MALETTRSETRNNLNRVAGQIDDTAAVFVGQPSDDIDGLELSAAAQLLGISVDDIWRQVRNGKLIARTERGRVLVYTDCESLSAVEGLPPLPGAHAPVDTADRTGSYATSLDQNKASRMEELYPSALVQSPSAERQEIALLIDHLSLAKEENREILRLTNESMSRLSEMTDKMLEMKDSIIASKDEQMQILKERLAEQTKELRQALQEKEDLETLTEALQRS